MGAGTHVVIGVDAHKRTHTLVAGAGSGTRQRRLPAAIVRGVGPARAPRRKRPPAGTTPPSATGDALRVARLAVGQGLEPTIWQLDSRANGDAALALRLDASRFVQRCRQRR